MCVVITDSFYNFAWYLGFEQEGGENHKLFRFERLDRLYIQKETDKTRTITEQKKALNKLTKLLSASYGLYLGNDVEQQKLFLSSDKQKAQETVELWFTEKYLVLLQRVQKDSLPNK